ncbi:hypothetical protein [Lysobacter sp. F60174L2]|uniref:hypothetical protein n=1 Tax=Lysobacter sp. F60174L2 TaxID=3459295 RepID=UPI00403D9E77
MQVPDRQKLSGITFAEPLSPETETKRRNLLFASCFSILLAVYGLKVTKTPWLDFEIPDGAPNILHGALSASLLYTFIVFALHAFADLRRWLTAGDMMYLHNYFDLTLKTRGHLNAVTQWLDKPLPTEPEKRASVAKMYASADSFLGELDAAVSAAKGSHRKLSALQWTRLALIDLGIPLVLGIFAMCKIGPALLPFLAVVWGET